MTPELRQALKELGAKHEELAQRRNLDIVGQASASISSSMIEELARIADSMETVAALLAAVTLGDDALNVSIEDERPAAWT